MVRLAFYFIHHETLGHTSRSVSVLRGLKERFGDEAEILIFSSGKRQDFADIEKYGRVVYLPFPIGKEFFYRDALRSKIAMMGDRVKEILKTRVRLMKKHLNEFKPDVFMTEYFPAGKDVWHFEMPPVLKHVKKLGSRVVSSIGYPSYGTEMVEVVESFYDALLFHCSELDVEFFLSALKDGGYSTKEFQGILDKFSSKILFTGYVVRGDKKDIPAKDAVGKELGLGRSQKLVVVSRGGGVVYPRIISSALSAGKVMDDTFFLISTGPAAGKAEFSAFENAAGGLENVKLMRYIPRFGGYLNASDLSINMNGYNTSVELMWLRKQSLSIPVVPAPEQKHSHVRPWGMEQVYRANMLKELGLAKILNYYSLSGDMLSREIVNMLESPLKPSRKVDDLSFSGAEETARFVENLMVGKVAGN